MTKVPFINPVPKRTYVLTFSHFPQNQKTLCVANHLFTLSSEQFSFCVCNFNSYSAGLFVSEHKNMSVRHVNTKAVVCVRLCTAGPPADQLVHHCSKHGTE